MADGTSIFVCIELINSNKTLTSSLYHNPRMTHEFFPVKLA